MEVAKCDIPRPADVSIGKVANSCFSFGQRIALAVNGAFSYLATDGLGSVSAAFDANGSPVASALFRPYGGLRYSSGAMPGSIGFTGQHSDAAVTGLELEMSARDVNGKRCPRHAMRRGH